MTKDEIRDRREKLQLTQKQLAARFGLNHNTVSRWESGAIVPEAMGMLDLALTALELEARVTPERRKDLKELRQSGRALKRLANAQSTPRQD